jgi:hypothetical protein
MNFLAPLSDFLMLCVLALTFFLGVIGAMGALAIISRRRLGYFVLKNARAKPDA